MEEKKTRIEYLVELLNKAGYAYEQENVEIMSNYEYDRLYDELLKLEEETGYVMSKSPTVNVGYEVVSELPKERHASLMLSLNKTKSTEDLKAFLDGKEGLISWKMDGLTNVLTYSNGELVKAVTRGNGEVGEIITNNARTYKNVPLKIPYKGELVIRGEAIITYSEFERINSQIEDSAAKYKNPRNLCSGSVRQLNSKITAERNVLLYVFGLISASDITFASRKQGFDWLESMGFTCVEHRLIDSANFDTVFGYFKNQVAKNDFPSDGLVLCYDDVEYSSTLGQTAKFPRDAIAFKWQDETARTKMLGIEWSASRTGLINPVALFSPVELEGTTVSRASIHNVSIMESLKLGEGDEIEVYKANMIIPQISLNHTKSGTFVPPCNCPVCNAKTIIKDEEGVRVLICPNDECPAKTLKAFTLFVSRDAMNIDGISENTIEKWIAEGILKNPADLFKIKDFREKITGMEGFGEKSFENAVTAIEKARHTTCVRVLYSLGIPGIGIATAKLLCRAFSNDIEKIRKATYEELVDIDQIGEVTARDYVSFFMKEKNNRLLDSLLSEVELEGVSEDSLSQKFSGMTFVITGSVLKFKNRKELQEYIENNGGKVANSVSSKTTYLINNDNMSNSTKNKTARSLSVKVITEDEFLAL